MVYHEKAYAKVNLGLRVLNKRNDGFHPLKTIFHKIDLYDEILININESNETRVLITGNEEYINGGVDLMEKAALLFSRFANKNFEIKINIKKNLPFQAGLGGGSSDAATVLLTLNKHFNNILNNDDIMVLGLSLGSDVPFFLTGFDAAYGEGRGEILKEVESVNYPAVILKKNSDKVSTKEAFRLLDERKEVCDTFPSWPLEINKWQAELINDFDIIQNIRKEDEFKLLAKKARYNTTSGSGSCQLLVFSTEEEVNEFLKVPSSYLMLTTKLKSSLHKN